MENVRLGLNISEISKEKRNPVIMVTRVLAMWMIIGCHVSSWLAIPAVAMVFNVGVYVFLVISGMLYAEKPINDGVEFIKKRWIKLCIPMYYLYAFLLLFNILNGKPQVIQSIPTYLLNFQGIEFIITALKPYQINGMGHLWFLTAIMACYFLLIPVKKLERRKDRKEELRTAPLFVVLFLVDILFVYTVRVQLNYFITFFLGYVLAGYISKLGKQQYILLSVTMILAVLTRLICKSWADGTVLYNDLVVPFTHIALAFWILGTVQFTARCVPDAMKICAESRVITWLDKFSLYLYMTHYMFLVGPLYVSHLSISVPMQLLVFLSGAFASGMLLQTISEATIRRIRV